MKKFLFIIFLFCFGTFSAILVSEIGLRIIDGLKIKRIDPNNSFSKDPLIYSPTVKYREKPYFTQDCTIQNDKDHKAICHVNKLSLRENKDFDFSKPKNTYRIIFLGDSLTYGLGVNNDKTYPKQLDQIIKSHNKTKTNYEIINLGMSFYGPSQYYYLYKELGKKYNPDLVIVGYHLLTDTWDSLEYDENKRYYLLKSIPDLIVPKSLGSFLKQNSFLYKLFLSAWYSYANKQDVMANNVAFNEIRNGSQYQNQLNSNSDIIKKAWISSENYLKLLEKEVHSSNSKIIFLSIPAKAQIYPDEWKDIKKRGLVADEKLYSDSQSRKKLNMLCGKNKWDCLDLQDGLRNATKDAQMFLEKDFHFTNEGNKTVASEIYKYLINKKIIKVN